MAELAMFPLGSVLFPSLVLPLHVFEPRYRALVHDILDGDRMFGVCLIERGSEVGGHDRRLPVGTVAEVREAAEMPDGRWALVTVGTRRIRVDGWLDDDPYPRAEVSEFVDPPPNAAQLVLADEVEARLRSAHAKAAALGDPPMIDEFTLSDDPTLASYQASALAPVSTIDQYALLAAPSVGLRLAALHAALGDVHEVLDLRRDHDGG